MTTSIIALIASAAASVLLIIFLANSIQRSGYFSWRTYLGVYLLVNIAGLGLWSPYSSVSTFDWQLDWRIVIFNAVVLAPLLTFVGWRFLWLWLGVPQQDR